MRDMEAKLCGYSHLQNSKPQSLAWAAGDNPVGQAAWILERFHDWADLRERSFEEAFTMEELIDTVMIYVMTGVFYSSLRFYSTDIERGLDWLPQGIKVEVPTAFTWFNDPLQPHPPRSLVVKGYNVVRWTEMARGGHFPALEEPELLARSCAAGRGRRRLDDVPTSRRREQFSSMERLLSDSLLHAAEHSLEAYRVARSISGLDQVIRAAGASRVGRKRRDEILLQR